MQIPRDHMIIGMIALTLVFLVAGGFLLLYMAFYNSRKKRHAQEKELMQKSFEQELTKTQLEVQEQTLRTIGRDIHDNIGQLLSLTKLTLGSVQLELQPEKTKGKVANALVLVDDSIKELRHLASILHAEKLLTDGLENAIEKELGWLTKTECLFLHFQLCFGQFLLKTFLHQFFFLGIPFQLWEHGIGTFR